MAQIIYIARTTTTIPVSLNYGAPAFVNIATEPRLFIGDSNNLPDEINNRRVQRLTTGTNTLLTKQQVVDAGIYITCTANLLTISIPSVTSTDDGLIVTVGNASTASFAFTVNSNNGYLIGGYSSILLDPEQYLRLTYNNSITQWEYII
jgi:hypothetical protein